MARNNKKYMQVEESVPDVHAGHPLRNAKAHEALLEYCKERIDIGVYAQAGLRARYSDIDRELAGYLKLEKEDQRREQDNKAGTDVKPVKFKPQVVLNHLCRGVTYLVSVFSPDSDLYEALTTADEQQVANAFVKLMNSHAIKGQTFRQQCLYFLNALKYNLAGMNVEWVIETGNKISDEGGRPIVEPSITWSGNKVRCADAYNTFWDPSVHPIDVYKDGEFVGEVEMISEYQFKKMIADGSVFNIGDFCDRLPQLAPKWFYDVPQVRFAEIDGMLRPDGTTNWSFILSAGNIANSQRIGVELTHLYIRLIPGEHNLISRRAAERRKNFEVWRITIANGERIVATEYMNNAHDYLPYCFGVPFEDNLGLQTKSAAENLLPFQNLAAFVLNAHVEATRKNIWDLIIYDPNVVDLRSVGSDVAARVPAQPGGFGKDLSKSIYHFKSNLKTEENIAQFEKLLEIIEYLFPTRMLQQVADIDRAVKDQVAVTVQASQREAWKIAKLLDQQCMYPVRHMSHMNILQYQESLTITSINGEKVEINPAQFRQLNLDEVIGEGLKSMDRLTQENDVRALINILLQTQAYTEFDIVGLVNYLSSFLGMRVDLTQFRRQTPPPAVQEPQPAQGTAQ